MGSSLHHIAKVQDVIYRISFRECSHCKLELCHLTSLFVPFPVIAHRAVTPVLPSRTPTVSLEGELAVVVAEALGEIDVGVMSLALAVAQAGAEDGEVVVAFEGEVDVFSGVVEVWEGIGLVVIQCLTLCLCLRTGGGDDGVMAGSGDMGGDGVVGGERGNVLAPPQAKRPSSLPRTSLRLISAS